MSAHIRKVKTVSGATAVQIVEKRSGVRRILEHLGSAHDDAGVAALVRAGQEHLNAEDQAFEFDLSRAGAESVPLAHSAVVAGSQCEVLWEVLAEAAYSRLRFDVLGDEAFAAMVFARLVEPASKAATVGILEDLGVATPHRDCLSPTWGCAAGHLGRPGIRLVPAVCPRGSLWPSDVGAAVRFVPFQAAHPDASIRPELGC